MAPLRKHPSARNPYPTGNLIGCPGSSSLERRITLQRYGLDSRPVGSFQGAEQGQKVNR